MWWNFLSIICRLLRVSIVALHTFPMPSRYLLLCHLFINIVLLLLIFKKSTTTTWYICSKVWLSSFIFFVFFVHQRSHKKSVASSTFFNSYWEITDYGHPMRVFFYQISQIFWLIGQIDRISFGVFRVFWVVLSAQILSLCIHYS